MRACLMFFPMSVEICLQDWEEDCSLILKIQYIILLLHRHLISSFCYFLLKSLALEHAFKIKCFYTMPHPCKIIFLKVGLAAMETDV